MMAILICQIFFEKKPIVEDEPSSEYPYDGWDEESFKKYIREQYAAMEINQAMKDGIITKEGMTLPQDNSGLGTGETDAERAKRISGSPRELLSEDDKNLVDYYEEEGLLTKAEDFGALQFVSHDGPHVWRKGVLPGSKYIKSCQVPKCGVFESIEYAEYITLP